MTAGSCKRRTLLGVTVMVGASLTLWSAGAAAKTPKLPKGKPIVIDKACTLVSRGQANFVWKLPTERDASNGDSPVTTDCAIIVGPKDAPVGRLVMSVIFPVFGGSETDAVNVVESDRANAQLSGTGIVDLPLGKGGFLQKPRSYVEVAPSKHFAFTLQWLPTGGDPDGGPITDKVRKQLTTLAADAAQRAKRL
jgi:hypothetical protein